VNPGTELNGIGRARPAASWTSVSPAQISIDEVVTVAVTEVISARSNA